MSWYDDLQDHTDWLGIPEPRRNDELMEWIRLTGSPRGFATRGRAENIQDAGVVISQPNSLL